MSKMSKPFPPPLIRAKHIPFWLTLRDVVLTALAWLVIAQSMHDGLYLLYDYFSPPVFELTHHTIPEILIHIWDLVTVFMIVAFLMVAWLTIWAIYGTVRLQKTPAAVQPTSLSVREHANYFGFTEDDLVRWKTYRIAVVSFADDNQIAGVSQQDLAPTVAAAAG